MRIKSLTVQGFRLFSKKQVVEFPNNGLVAIVGPSGSGKSSIFQAIGLALGYSSFAASKQQTWGGDTPMQVDLALTGTDELLIRRGKVNEVKLNGETVAKGATEINKWLPTFFGVDAAMLKAMTFQPQRSQGAFLSMKNDARRLFLTSVLGLQKYEKGLAGVKADLSEKSRALDDAKLVVETLEANLPALRQPGYQTLRLMAVEGVDPDANQIDADLDAIFNPLIKRCADTHAQLGEFQDRLRAEVAKVNEKRDGVLEIIKAEISNLETRLRIEQHEITETHKAREAALPRPVAEPSSGIIEARIEKVRQKLLDTEAELAAVNTELRNSTSKATQISVEKKNLLAELVRQQNVVENVKRRECPTCHQEWNEGQLATQLERLAAIERGIESLTLTASILASDLVKAQARHDELGAIKTKITAVGKQLADELAADNVRRAGNMNAATAALQAEIMKIRSSYATAYNDAQENFGHRIRAAREAFDKTRLDFDESCTELRRQIEQTEGKKHEVKLAAVALREQFAGAVNLQKSIRAEIAAAKESNKARATVEQKILAARQSFEKLEAGVAELQDLEAATKAFLSVINQEILAEIADEANEIIGALPNSKHIRVAFRTEKLTGAGDLKAEIRAVISLGDEEDVDFESGLSGGQQTSVELATDRAVAKVLRRRAGGTRLPEWVCLDEAFNGHDLSTKEACTEVLQHMAVDTQIFVIDHGSEFQASFDRVLTVEPGAEGSTIK